MASIALSPQPDLDIDGDVIRRGIKRTLPCKLTEREFMQISKMRVDKEALLAQLAEDLAKEKKKRQDQIDELEDEITKMGRELHTGEQDRTVDCLEVFRRADDGTGWVHTLRINKADDGTKTYEEVEQRPASPAETQRYLPGIEGEPVKRAAPLFAHAAATQAAEPDELPATELEAREGVSAELDHGSGGSEDDDLSERPVDWEPAATFATDESPADALAADGMNGNESVVEEMETDEPPAQDTPAQRAARESAQAREARRNKGKSKGRGKNRGSKGGRR